MTDPDPNDDRTVIRPQAGTLADRDSNTLPVGTRLGEFELVGVIGVGGFGIVYLAQDHSLERRVAVKEYMPSSLAARRGGHSVVVHGTRQRETFEAGLKSFINEAKLLAQFDHPALVKVYRFWEANGTAYMVMPHYQGTTLKEHLNSLAAPPDEAWLRALLAPLTEALAVIHASHCYHRDIAPDNIILLAGSGRPLLLDFGAARRVIGDMTQALTVILKPGYAPLEQYAETPHMRQGPWTDVYALAAVVHHAITGKTPPVSVGRILRDSHVPLVDSVGGRYSHGFLAAIDHALQVKPEDRTPSIAALRAELGLQAASSDLPVAAAPPAAVASPTQAAAAVARPRGPLLWGLGLVVLALAGVAGFLLRAPSAPQVPAPTASPAPVAVAPAAVVPAASAGPFSVDAEFARVLQGQSPDFAVAISMPKTQLRVARDQLRFTVSSARDGHVYVLLRGPDGSLVLLLPNDNAPDLRIRAGQPLKLPPDSSRFDAAEPLGREDFLVLVSPTPRSFDGLGGQRQEGFLVLPTGGDTLAQRAAAHSGPGSVLAGQPLQCVGAACKPYGAARFSVDVVR